MRIFAPKPCKVVVMLMMISSLSTFAQPDLIASADEVEESNAQSESSVKLEVLVVDSDSKVKSYPSMEEEMEMYVKLRGENPQVFFFPNPSTGVVWIEHNLGRECSIRIYDTLDRVLFTADKMQAKKLDLAAFDAGTYFIEASSGDVRVRQVLEVR